MIQLIIKYLIPITIFALFDFFGYNYSEKNGYVNDKLINPYRIVQTIVQIIIAVLTFYLFGWKPAIVFIWLWWNWVADWIYYIFCIPFYFYCGKDEWKKPFENVVTWAWWTLLGLIIGKENGNHPVIHWQMLIIQSIFGIIFGIIFILEI